ncbi:hypothetical protein TNCV_645931 [Trichonephila clavipes]|nr:hypothetical protein TNCV_645931 [Trichonephila clavipes]
MTKRVQFQRRSGDSASFGLVVFRKSAESRSQSTYAGCGLSCSAPDYRTVLEVRVPIPQSSFVSVVGCSPEDVIMLQGIFPKHPTHVLWDLNKERTLADIFAFQ